MIALAASHSADFTEVPSSHLSQSPPRVDSAFPKHLLKVTSGCYPSVAVYCLLLQFRNVESYVIAAIWSVVVSLAPHVAAPTTFDGQCSGPYGGGVRWVRTNPPPVPVANKNPNLTIL